MLDRRMTIHMLKPVDSMLLSGGRKLQQSKEEEKGEAVSKERILPEEEKDEVDQHYEVSGIMDHRLNWKKSGYQYLVRWKGFTAEEDTWEPEENFDNMAVIKQYWKQQQQRQIFFSLYIYLKAQIVQS